MIALFNDIPFLWVFSFFLALYLLKSIIDYLFGRFIQPHIDRKIARDRAELRLIELEFFRSMSRRAGPDPRDMIDALNYANKGVDDFCDAVDENPPPPLLGINDHFVDTHPAGSPFPPLPRPRCIQLPLAEVPITESDVHEFGSDHRIPPRPLVPKKRPDRSAEP